MFTYTVTTQKGVDSMQGQDTYSLERTIEFPNMKVRIFRPVLTNEERTKRMQNIHKASSNLMKEVRKK